MDCLTHPALTGVVIQDTHWGFAASPVEANGSFATDLKGRRLCFHFIAQTVCSSTTQPIRHALQVSLQTTTVLHPKQSAVSLPLFAVTVI